MAEENYEEDFEEDDEEVSTLPYYRQAHPQVAIQQKGCLATVWEVFLHLIVTHISLALCLGTIVLGVGVLVKGITRLGWHGFSTIILDGLMILAYVGIVIAVVSSVSHLAKRITKDENF